MLITLQDTPALRLHADDDVAIALVPLSANRRIEVGEHRAAHARRRCGRVISWRCVGSKPASRCAATAR